MYSHTTSVPPPDPVEDMLSGPAAPVTMTADIGYTEIDAFKAHPAPGDHDADRITRGMGAVSLVVELGAEPGRCLAHIEDAAGKRHPMPADVDARAAVDLLTAAAGQHFDDPQSAASWLIKRVLGLGEAGPAVADGTIPIKIAVAVQPDGTWSAAGASDRDDARSRQMVLADVGPATIHWITAEIPRPDAVANPIPGNLQAAE